METLQHYFEQRSNPGELHALKLLDAAMCLALAEHFRKVRDFDVALDWIRRAVEAHPGIAAFAALESEFSPRKRINGQSALSPKLTKPQRHRCTKSRESMSEPAKGESALSRDAGNR